jgi:hypothetical protein
LIITSIIEDFIRLVITDKDIKGRFFSNRKCRKKTKIHLRVISTILIACHQGGEVIRRITVEEFVIPDRPAQGGKLIFHLVDIVILQITFISKT